MLLGRVCGKNQGGATEEDPPQAAKLFDADGGRDQSLLTSSFLPELNLGVYDVVHASSYVLASGLALSLSQHLGHDAGGLNYINLACSGELLQLRYLGHGFASTCESSKSTPVPFAWGDRSSVRT